MVRIEDFFSSRNKVSGITDKDYWYIPPMITTLKACARMTYASWYIIDFFRENFLHVSKNSFFLCGHTSEEVETSGYDFYLQHVPEDEIGQLVEVNRAGFEFYNKIPVKERTQHVLSHDFHIINGKRKVLINHKLTPLVLSKDGAVWLAVCVVALSPYKEAGHIEIHKSDAINCWIYSLKNHRWTENIFLTLSHQEKDILLLSARGYTVEEIARLLFLAADTIKFHKKSIFERLRVKNIAEALAIAGNYNIF
jgi:DNA-binding CsgD family transcriptional regulator